MTTLDQRIEVQMKRAFWDLLEERVAAIPPDFEWIINLYSEIRERLCSFVKSDGKTYKEIREVFDVKLFSQMLRKEAFEGEDMIRLINSTFGLISKLQAPERDQELKVSQQELLDYARSGGTFARIVTMYIKTVHKFLDHLNDDMQTFIKSINKEKKC